MLNVERAVSASELEKKQSSNWHSRRQFWMKDIFHAVARGSLIIQN
jgi:hypothetical protein